MTRQTDGDRSCTARLDAAVEATGTVDLGAGGRDFHSESYQWLVISGARAQYKGTGRVNGADGYGFLLTVIDAALTPSTEVDRFRIKIWWIEDGGEVIYDNERGTDSSADPTTEIAGGQIVIHKGK